MNTNTKDKIEDFIRRQGGLVTLDHAAALAAELEPPGEEKPKPARKRAASKTEQPPTV